MEGRKMFECIETKQEKALHEKDRIGHEDGYGYNLTQLIRETLMWKLGLPLQAAQELAEGVSEQAYYANWLVATLPSGKWNTFKN